MYGVSAGAEHPSANARLKLHDVASKDEQKHSVQNSEEATDSIFDYKIN